MKNIFFDQGLPLPSGWGCANAGDFRRKRSNIFNPASYSVALDKKLELWSIPSYSRGTPEIVFARDIGSAKQYVAPGDVLISKINPRLNRTWVIGNKREFPQIASTEWVVFPRAEEIDSRFLSILLSDSRIKNYLATNASGVGGSLTRARPQLFDQIRIPIPPFNEQRRIVEKIEALFTEIDQGVESLRAAKKLIALYRQSLLKAAFEGHLTANWRARNTDDPDNSDSASMTNLPAGWARVSLEELITPDGIFTDGDWVESKDQDPNGEIRLIQLADIADSRFVDKSSRFLTRGKAKELNCTFLKKGDLMVARMPDPLGRCCIFPLEEDNRFVTVVDVCIIRLGSAEIDPQYLMRAINSPIVRAEIATLQSGSTRKRISRKNLATITIPIAPLKEQREIVRILDARLEAVGALDQEIDAAFARAEGLRQSILKKAFSGKLVPQDPNDEPALDLLARIKAERAGAPARRRNKRAVTKI